MGAASVVVDRERVLVRLQGAARLLFFRREVEVDTAAIRDVRLDAELAGSLAARVFLVGYWIWLPGVVFAGDLRRRSGREFWAVSPDDTRAVVVELDAARYDRLVLSVDDPGPTAERIRVAAAS